MQSYFLKKTPPISDDTPLFIHYGIPRTGSSTVRGLIRNYCNLVGLKWRTFGMDKPINEQIACLKKTHFLLLDIPYPIYIHSKRPKYIFTTLRDPIDHILSTFRWLKQVGKYPSNFLDFVANLPNNFNYMSRWLAALNDVEPCSVHCSQHLTETTLSAKNNFYTDIPNSELLEKAQESLSKKIALVGILENLLPFSIKLAEFCSWSLIPITERINFTITPNHNLLEQLPESLKDKLYQASNIDHQIFTTTKAMLDDSYKQLALNHPDYFELYKKLCKGHELFTFKDKNVYVNNNKVYPKPTNKKNQNAEFNFSREDMPKMVFANDFMSKFEQIS